MSRKAIAILAGIIAFFVGSLVARKAIDLIRREPAVAGDIVTRQWIAQSVGPSGVTFDAPWPLQTEEMQFPSQLARMVKVSKTLSHEADGLNIMTMYTEFVPGTSISLEGAAEGAIGNLKTVPGTRSVHGSKQPSSLMQQQAFQIEAGIERERGVPLQMKGVVFGEGPELYQIILVARSDQPLAADAWNKLVASIRRTAP